jgi:hypothetical protein
MLMAETKGRLIQIPLSDLMGESVPMLLDHCVRVRFQVLEPSIE